jgi:hypothetical protein
MTESSYQIPSNLSECIEALDIIMTESKKEDVLNFKLSKEKDCLYNTHHALGQWIRNNWGLWKKESALYNYFYKMGLWHADDISSVIIISYHRHINEKKINLKKQIDKYIKYWNNYQKQNGPIIQ